MNEFEQKIMLTEAEYDRMLEVLGSMSRPSTQINHYYDTEDLSMNTQNVTCRVRVKNGKYQATMKVHIPDSDCSVEIDMPTPCSIDDNVFIAMGLKYQGKLTTDRSIIFQNGEFELALDKNTYLGVVDYELEIEHLGSTKQNKMDILSHLINTLYYEMEIECLLYEYVENPYFRNLICVLQEIVQNFNKKQNLSSSLQNKSQRFLQRKMAERG